MQRKGFAATFANFFCSICVGHILFVGSTAVALNDRGMFDSFTNLILVHSVE